MKLIAVKPAAKYIKVVFHYLLWGGKSEQDTLHDL
jgi:hypothetical protein